jgi:membrane protein DedA with SNARE-associated domain
MGSLVWAISLILFLAGIGFPVPENPILVGGGYALYQKQAHPLPSLCLWFLAIIAGDLVLFSIVSWFFERPALSGLIRRWVGQVRLERYRRAFANWGGWTLFLARFAFGVRAAAYVAAGAAGYPWRRFLFADCFSVGIQVLLFVGIGYFAGDRMEWAESTSGRIALLLAIVVLFTVLLTWLCSVLVRRVSNQKE